MTELQPNAFLTGIHRLLGTRERERERKRERERERDVFGLLHCELLPRSTTYSAVSNSTSKAIRWSN